jgi:hypothetical protein
MTTPEPILPEGIRHHYSQRPRANTNFKNSMCEALLEGIK